MSVKSLLQIILLLLIFFIIGGIYYKYLYSNSSDNQNSKTLDYNLEDQQNINQSDNLEEQVLEAVKISENKNSFEENKLGQNNSNNNIDTKDNNQILKTNQIKDANKKNVNNKIKNLTKEIEYITTNKKGDTFKILAKFGKTNPKNSNILDLEKVEGTISSLERSPIFISSNYANYNYTNQNSKFFNNVKIQYDGKIITSDNFDLIISDNIAVAHSNVIISDDKSTMKAQVVILDIITKDIKINSDDKINIITN